MLECRQCDNKVLGGKKVVTEIEKEEQREVASVSLMWYLLSLDSLKYSFPIHMTPLSVHVCVCVFSNTDV